MSDAWSFPAPDPKSFSAKVLTCSYKSAELLGIVLKSLQGGLAVCSSQCILKPSAATLHGKIARIRPVWRDKQCISCVMDCSLPGIVHFAWAPDALEKAVRLESRLQSWKVFHTYI